MRIKTFILCVFLLVNISITGLQAQEASPSSGGNASGSGGSVSYTAGQVTYTVHATDNGSLSQGLQQPTLSQSGQISSPNEIKTFKIIKH